MLSVEAWSLCLLDPEPSLPSR